MGKSIKGIEAGLTSVQSFERKRSTFNILPEPDIKCTL